MNKVAIFSDLHLGIKQDSAIWHEIALNWCDWFVDENKKRGIKDVVFLGDFFHTRNTISANTLHVASKVLDKLSDFNLHFILGNHDLYYANNPEVSPVNLFQGRGNLRVYARPEIVNFGNKTALMCGWGYNPEDYEADVLFTHAEISTFRYNLQVAACEEGFKPSGLLKKYNTVYTGHFHLRQEKSWNEKSIVYVGNTFPMDHSDTCICKKGFEIYDFDNNAREFVENNISPKFYRIRLSELAENNWQIEELVNIIRGNTVKLIIDRNITYQDANTLSGLFNANNPLDFSVEWELEQKFKEADGNIKVKVFDMQEAIRKYIELLDINGKEEVTEYVLRLYEKAQG